MGASVTRSIGIAVRAHAASQPELRAARRGGRPVTHDMATAADRMPAAPFPQMAGPFALTGHHDAACPMGRTGAASRWPDRSRPVRARGTDHVSEPVGDGLRPATAHMAAASSRVIASGAHVIGRTTGVA